MVPTETTPTAGDPTISVVIPTWNRAQLLTRSLRSVLSQTFSDFEVIVVDDGSTDETRDVLADFSDPRLSYLFQVNQGESAARNAGASAARGAFLTFLDSDDEVHPRWLELLVSDLISGQADLVLCGREIHEDGLSSSWVPNSPGLDEIVHHFEAGQVAFGTSQFLASGGFATAIRYGQHTELAIRLLCGPNPPRLRFVAQSLVIVHRQAGDRGYGFAPIDSARYVLEQHPDCRRALPHLWGSYQAIVGVDLARRRRFAAARHHFAAALKSEPRQWRHLIRMMASTVPALGRRVWTDDTEGRPVLLSVAIAPGLGGSMRSLASVLAYLDGVSRAVACPPDTTFTEFLQQRQVVDELVPVAVQGRSRLVARLSASLTIGMWAWRHRHRLVAIHANGLAERNLVTLAALVTRVPVVVWMHEWSVSPWARRLAPFLSRLAPLTRFAAVSEDAQQSLVEAGLAPIDRIEVVPNPIDPADVVAVERVLHSQTTIAYLGTPARYKGFHLLPEIIRAVNCDVDWLIYAGPQTMLPEVWAELETLAQVPGKVLDVREAYASCDIVICPSLSESFGRVAAEAMANGLPVVTSDLPPLRALVGEGADAAGLLAPPGDTAAAAELLCRLVADEELRRRLGASGRQRAAAFAPAPIVEKLVALYGYQTR
jgi:glycosyltransferase involved in cell wall biosynthesis